MIPPGGLVEKRAWVRVDPDKVEGLAQKLRAKNIFVEEVSPVVGQITVNLFADEVSSIRELVAVDGGTLTTEDEEVKHTLPGPESDQ